MSSLRKKLAPFQTFQSFQPFQPFTGSKAVFVTRARDRGLLFFLFSILYPRFSCFAIFAFFAVKFLFVPFDPAQGVLCAMRSALGYFALGAFAGMRGARSLASNSNVELRTFV